MTSVVEPITLTCKGCGASKRFPKGSITRGVPLEVWFREQGSLCGPCRSRNGLPTVQQAKAAADAGRDAAYEAANEQWKADAYQRVLALAATKQRFTSNDLWAGGLVDPPNGQTRRALGGVLMRAARDGLIQKVGSGAVSLHGHGASGNAYWCGT